MAGAQMMGFLNQPPEKWFHRQSLKTDILSPEEIEAI